MWVAHSLDSRVEMSEDSGVWSSMIWGEGQGCYEAKRTPTPPGGAPGQEGDFSVQPNGDQGWTRQGKKQRMDRGLKKGESRPTGQLQVIESLQASVASSVKWE